MSVDDRDSGGGGIHDLQEVERALSALGPAELARLAARARARIRGFGIDPHRHSPEDLFHEAITQTLSGRRKWKRGRAFDLHLRRAMRSIASNWKRSSERAAAAGADEVRFSKLWADGEKVDPKDLPASLQGVLASPAPGAESGLIAMEQIEAVLRRSAGDEAAKRVIDGLFEGLTVREMGQRLEVTERQVESTKERIRRRARRIKAGDDE